jgi:hypothetical protein
MAVPREIAFINVTCLVKSAVADHEAHKKSPNFTYSDFLRGGLRGSRTPDLCNANAAL